MESKHDRLPSFEEHASRLAATNLRALVQDEARGERLRRRMGPILLDASRQKLDIAALDAVGEYIESTGWKAARDAMFEGKHINTSEDRAVLHTALRGGASRNPAAPADVRKEVADALDKMETLVNAVHKGEGESVGLIGRVTDVVNIGIGGSDL